MNDIMLDLETMGSGSMAAITAIGAVRFDPYTGELGDEFLRAVELRSSQREGLTIDASTVLWWLEQSREAIDAMLHRTRPIRHALVDFSGFVMQGPARPLVWGNRVGFDNVILRNAYRACGMECPWSFRADRDMRTIVGLYTKSLQPTAELVKPENDPDFVAHNALHDAKAQARYVAHIYQQLGLKKGAQ